MKKCLSFMLVLTVLVSCFALSFNANAAEAGTLPSNAIVLTQGSEYLKYWTYTSAKLNCYNKITISTKGIVTLTLHKPYDSEGEICSYKLDLMDESGQHVWACNTDPQTDTFSENYIYRIGLNAGVYYLNVKASFFVSRYSAPIPGPYKYDFAAENYCETESNNTQATATPLELNKMYFGVYTDESYEYTYVDYYSINLTSGKKYELRIDNFENLDASTLLLYLVDTSGKKTNLTKNTIAGTVAKYEITPTTSGTYYVLFDNAGNKKGIDYKVGVFADTGTEVSYKLGDVDNDGLLTSADARLTLRASVKLENYAVGSKQYICCDVDKIDGITSADARMILRASVNLEDPKNW